MPDYELETQIVFKADSYEDAGQKLHAALLALGLETTGIQIAQSVLRPNSAEEREQMAIRLTEGLRALSCWR